MRLERIVLPLLTAAVNSPQAFADVYRAACAATHGRVLKALSALARIASKVFERWLISRIDMPSPGNARRSRWISSSTGTGITAGPAEKSNTR